MLVETPQIALPQRNAVAVEEFEDLDRHLAAVGEAVAQLSGGEGASFRVGRHVGRMVTISAGPCRRKKWSCATSSARPIRAASFSSPPDVAFGPLRRLRDVAYARRPEPIGAAEQRRDDAPGRLVLGREARRMCREADERTVENQFAVLRRLLQGDAESGCWQPRL